MTNKQPAVKEHTQGHRQRLRARMLENPSALADYEVLELLLGHVLLRQDTKPLAKQLLGHFDSLRGVLDARPAELAAVPGFGPSLAAFWSLLREMMARYTESPVRQRLVLSSPQAVALMARQRLGSSPHEEIWIAYLDSQNRLLSWERAATGTPETAPLYPRNVMERALALKATGIIVVHNHPGGNPKPSGSDITLTDNMKAAARTLGVRFLDHVIVTDDACYSIVQDGIIQPSL